MLDFKKQERQAEVKELEQSISRLQKKQLDIAAMEQIEAKNIPLSSKVMIDREDYQTLITAAQKYVVQEKKTGRLERLLKAAEKTIADLKAKLAEVMRERDELRFVRGFLSMGGAGKRKQGLAPAGQAVSIYPGTAWPIPSIWETERPTSIKGGPLTAV